MFRIIITILMFIATLISRIRYKMSISGVVTIFIGSIIGCLMFPNDILYMFFFCFIILGLVKLINKHYTKKTDINKYNINNFTYAGSIPFILAILISIFHFDYNYSLLIIMIIFSNLATLLIDTASGELGQSFKTNTYLITNLKKVKSGTDGGISLSGTILGLITCILYTLVIFLLTKINLLYLIIAVLISFIGNILDSIVGATLQKKNYVSNEQTNFISMIAISILAIVVFYCLI